MKFALLFALIALLPASSFARIWSDEQCKRIQGELEFYNSAYTSLARSIDDYYRQSENLNERGRDYLDSLVVQQKHNAFQRNERIRQFGAYCKDEK